MNIYYGLICWPETYSVLNIDVVIVLGFLFVFRFWRKWPQIYSK